MTPAMAATALTAEPVQPWAGLAAALAREPIVPGCTQARNRGAAAVADHPATPAQRDLDLGRAGLRAGHLLAPVHGPHQLPGQPPRGHQAGAGRQPRQLRPDPGRHPHPAADHRRRAVPGRGGRLEASAPDHRPGLRAAQPGRRGGPYRPGRRGDGGRARGPRHECGRSAARRPAPGARGRRALVLLAGDARARGRRARRLRALRQQAGPAVLPRLPAAGGSAEPARRGAPLARARLQARARPDDRRARRVRRRRTRRATCSTCWSPRATRRPG